MKNLFMAARREYSRGKKDEAPAMMAQDHGERIAAQRVTPLHWERLVNYLASYACTLLTIFAAYPVAPRWCLGLTMMTCAGLALSLELRRRDLRVGRLRVDRYVCNGFIVALSGAMSVVYVGSVVPGIGSDDPVTIAINLGEKLPNVIAMVVLIFAACRSLFILSDKDAFRSLVSFAVLFLLVVTQQSASMIVFFLLWTVAAIVLMALDHRAETRLDLGGVVPAPVPGQDVALSMRSLAGIVAFSLVCAAALSFALASSNADRTSATENWIVAVLTRLGVPGLENPDISAAVASERGINFTSRPATLSRTPVWRVAAYDLTKRRVVKPAYWRLYSLSFYNGATWQPRDRAAFPRRARSRRADSNLPRRVPLQTNSANLPQAPEFGPAPRRIYNITGEGPANAEKAFGAPASLVQQRVESLSSNTGFIPGLPVATQISLRVGPPASYLLSRADASLEADAMTQGRVALLWSRTPREGYQTQVTPPLLPAPERSRNLELPERLPVRVLALARRLAAEVKVERNAGAAARVLAPRKALEETTRLHTRLATRLAAFVRESGSYTLAPPPLLDERDSTDYFLFETHTGYCTHFASALAVLCRATGLPSRIVSGYVDPEWENDRAGSGILREASAHAWTEVWIEGHGWTAFDATPPNDRGENEPTASRTWELWWRGVLEGTKRRLGGAFPFVVALLCATFTLCVFLVLRSRLQRFKHRAVVTPSQHEDAPDAAVRREILQAYSAFEESIARGFRRRTAAETPRQWLQNAPRVLAGENHDTTREMLLLRDRALYQTRALNPGAAERARELLRLLA